MSCVAPRAAAKNVPSPWIKVESFTAAAVEPSSPDLTVMRQGKALFPRLDPFDFDPQSHMFFRRWPHSSNAKS